MQKKLFGFWGLRPQALTGALPVDPTGGLPFPRPLLPPSCFSWIRPSVYHVLWSIEA